MLNTSLRHPIVTHTLTGMIAVQAGKELAGVRSLQPWSQQSPAASSSSTALPLWQEQALTQLGLLGSHANAEVSLGGDPCVDPKLLAAVRILYCRDPSELQGRALVQLAAWGMPLNPANEVSLLTPRWYCCVIKGCHPTAVSGSEE